MTFVDVEAEPAGPTVPDAPDVLRAFQRLPRRLADTETLLLRWPDVAQAEPPRTTVRAWVDEIAARTAAAAIDQDHTGAVVFKIGEPPEIVWAQGSPPPSDDAVLLARARAAELWCLLDAGHGIWKPRRYHYRLPSGVHDTVFIRVADALRTPRDAAALATWLVGRAAHDRGVLIDSATVTPLVVALESILRQFDVSLGPVATLDDYPRTQLEVRRAGRQAAEGSGGIIGILSVSSSGTMQDYMVHGLDHAAPDEHSLDVLVDRQANDPERDPASDLSAWLTGADLGALQRPEAPCEACADNTRARIVQIHPASYEAMALADPELVVPSIKAGDDNARWWSLVAGAAATGVECRPHQEATASRPKEELMPIRFFLDAALLAEGAGEALSRRLTELRHTDVAARGGVAEALEAMKHADTLLMTTSDATILEPHLDHLSHALECPGAQKVLWQEGDPIQLEGKVVVLVAGAVTGSTLLRLRQVAAETAATEVHGLVVHARPERAREWQAMRNPFGGRLTALWLSYLPWRSPLREEARLLEEWKGTVDLDPGAAAFVNDRLGFCAPSGPRHDWTSRTREYESDVSSRGTTVRYVDLADASGPVPPAPTGLLWGQKPRGTGRIDLRGTPAYGTDLDPLTTYAAVGSAMQHAREQRSVRETPQWLMFEMPAICRSYFDAPLLATILRWTEPREAWWGSTSQESEQAIGELLSRNRDSKEDLVVLLPELLLAAAQGKVDDQAYQVLVTSLEELTHDWDENDRLPLEVGRGLATFARKAR